MRIVAGELRGRRLSVSKGRATRPTSERARAGLFDWLGPRVVGARVLDLFAGSGALGLEAVSRGAVSATFVERSRAALQALRQNVAQLEVEARATLVARDVAQFLARAAGPRFDLIFADPPWEADVLEALLGDAHLARQLAPDGGLIVERSVRLPRPRGSGELVWVSDKMYGETVFDLFEGRDLK